MRQYDRPPLLSRYSRPPLDSSTGGFRQKIPLHQQLTDLGVQFLNFGLGRPGRFLRRRSVGKHRCQALTSRSVIKFALSRRTKWISQTDEFEQPIRRSCIPGIEALRGRRRQTWHRSHPLHLPRRDNLRVSLHDRQRLRATPTETGRDQARNQGHRGRYRTAVAEETLPPRARHVPSEPAVIRVSEGRASATQLENNMIMQAGRFT
jgi:hypothetical protein